MNRRLLVTNHTLVLAAIANNNNMTVREIGDDIGITEAAVHKIIKDLERDGYLSRTRMGRRNVYSIYTKKLMKVADIDVERLLKLLGSKKREHVLKI